MKPNQYPTTSVSKDTVVNNVQDRLHRLRPAEARVANVLIGDPDQFFQWSVTEVAERAGVSEATVIRFAKLLGFTGFQALKITLAQERATFDHGVLEVDASDTAGSAITKLETYYREMFDSTMNVTRQASFQAAVDEIRDASRVVAIGVGTSGLAAQVFQYKLSRIGMSVIFQADSHFQALTAAGCLPGDVVVAFSVSGSTRDISDALTLAREAGAHVVAITHFARSPIARVADHVLLSQGFDSPVVSGSVLAHVSQLVIVDALSLYLAINDYEGTMDRMKHTAEEIARFKKY